MIRKLLHISCFITALAGLVAADEAVPMIDIDFSKSSGDFNLQGKGTFKGALPLGVIADFPSWNKGAATSSIIEAEGRKFLRFEVTNVDKDRKGPAGERLLFFVKPAVKIPEGYYKLRVEGCLPQGLSANIRQGPPRYTALRRVDFEADPEWKIHEILFRIKPITQVFVQKLVEVKTENLGLTFSLVRNGTTDLGAIKLFKADASEQALIDGWEKKAEKEANSVVIRPSEGCSNFIRNSRFPLGLPSGWGYSRWYNTAEISSDASDPGPSGIPSLAIKGNEIYTEPFNTPGTASGRKCLVTFFYKAINKYRVNVMAVNLDQKRDCIDGLQRSISETTLEPAYQWREASIVFDEPDANGLKCLYLSFDNPGLLKLDSLRIRYEGTESGTNSEDQCEVALAPVESTLSRERVQFTDEDSKIKYFVSGKFKDCTLKFRVFDVSGKSFELPDISSQEKFTGELNYLPGTRGGLMGQFRIESWAERNGERISPVNEIVMTRIRKPVYWGKDAPNSPFATVMRPQKVECLKAAGINWARLHDDGGLDYIGWAKLEPEKGKWVFRDKEISMYRDAKMMLMGSLYTVPHWASYYDGVKRPAYFDIFCQPRNLTDYANYVRTVLSRYKGVITEYMIWNEPTWAGAGNDSYYWHKSYNPETRNIDKNPDSIKEFIELSECAYRTAKEVDPSVKLIGINAGHANWVSKLFEGGAYSFCDMADIHFYSGENLLGVPGDDMETSFSEAIKMAEKAGIPLMNSEGNGLRHDPNIDAFGAAKDKGNDGTGIYKHSIAWRSNSDSVEVADSLCRFTMKNLVVGMKRVVLYSETCHTRLPMIPSFYIMLCTDGFPSPAYAAFSNLAWLLEDRSYVECVPVGKNVWAYIFEGRGGSVAVISGTKNGSYQAAHLDAVKCIDLFGNPSDGIYKGTLFYMESNLKAGDLVINLKK